MSNQSQHHHPQHPHRRHREHPQRDKDHTDATVPQDPAHGSSAKDEVLAAASSGAIPDKMTLYSEDGQWKAELKSWKDYWFFYASIGSQVDVYHRETTHDVWGNKTTDWVKRPASIFIHNTYQGNITGSPNPPGTTPNGPDGGLGTFVHSGEFNSDHGEFRLWAAGFFATKVTVGGEQTRPAGATLDINSVVAEITVATPGGSMRGTVGASSYVSDNSAWG
jgi:hypothetical protein